MLKGRFLQKFFAFAALFGAAASPAFSQVNLNALTSPTAAQPLAQVVSVTGSGFPSGGISPANVSITITPPAGNGSPVSISASAVTPVLGSTYKIGFLIPASLATAQPIANCKVAVSGHTNTNVNFSSNNTSSLQINPPPTLLSVTPGAGVRGNVVSVAVVGSYTHFTAAIPTLTVGSGADVAVSNVVVTDATHLTANLTIAANAVAGADTVTVKTGTEVASLAGGFLVSPNQSLTLNSILPSSAAAGSSLSINVTGTNTNFVPGTTIASFGDGVKVTGVTVVDATHATIAVQIDPVAVLGARTLTLQTGGEFAVAAAAFTVTSNGSSLGQINPATGAQGTNATVTLTGIGTHFTPGATTVNFGSGINVGNVTVNSATSLTANISIGPGAAVGGHTVSATTNGETVFLANAFNVTAATPYLSGVSPASGQQGQTLNVTISGVFTSFNTGALTANFGSNITVNSVTGTNATTAVANITIANTAQSGGRTATLSSNGTDYPFSFTVNPSAATLSSSVSPNSGYQGTSVALQVTGSGTHWAQGLTSASLGGLITVNRVVINSATSAEIDVTIPSTEGIGPHDVVLSTGGEVVNAHGAFTVLAATPSLSAAPSSGMIGTSVLVNLNGHLTHFSNQTVFSIDGQGVTVQNFQVTGPNSATAQFVISSSAPTAPAVACTNQYGGNRVITMETPLASGAEIVNAGFCVTSTPAVLTSISPFHSGEPAVNLNVEIQGAYTHFAQGTTTVGFGPNITVNSVTVNSSTDLVANISIDAAALIGWRPVYVNTGSEQLTIGFAIDPPSSATLLSIVPSSATQGQSLTVAITGNLTNFQAGVTEALLGAGVTVNSLTVNSSASATAQISIDPTTPTGGRTVTMLTGAEAVSGLTFGVTPGIANISLVGTGNFSSGSAHQFQVMQGAVVSFGVTGVGTHFLQGETVLNAGDIAVSNLVVVDATHLTCQLVIPYSATLGFRGLTATTNGEVAASFSDALDVTPAQATSLNITPASSPQGTTLTVQVNGVATHFTAGNTTATFGNNNGVNVTGVNVISATQMNLTVQVTGTASTGPYSLTVTTTGLPVPPNTQTTEQLTLNNVFSVTQGAAIITKVTPTSGAQGTTEQIFVTGQNTSFQTGVTTAYFSTAGCLPPYSAGINVTNVTATDATHATLAIAVGPTAPTGYQTLCMYTQGEAVSYGNAFQVINGTPTLNEVSPVSAQQGQTLSGTASVQLLGQFTHWQQGVTTATFGQGITLISLTVNSSTSATAEISVSPLAYPGGRTVTVTTNNEIVSGNFFSVTRGPALLTSISPNTANQGQHILMSINGDFTHWSQQLTQFSISGAGYDVTVNGVVITSNTSAIADLTFAPNAALGSRTVFMSTEGENVALAAGLTTTGGVPAVVSVNSGSGTRGDTADNIQITGAFTHWNSTTVVDFGDPAITVTPASTVNSATSITAVINIGAGAITGLHTVTVRTGSQALTGQFYVYDPAAPPQPYISYEYPGVALVGQTLQVNLTGSYTHWDPAKTTAAFGAGIIVNEFQVTGVNSAVANITIDPNAAVGSRTVTLTTGTEIESTSFLVTVGTPVISLVDPSQVIQGQTRLIDLVGQYTTWDNSTVFSFGSGITVNSIQIFGPTAARANVSVDITAQQGGRSVTSTTGSQVAYGGISVGPSQASISAVSPNTAIQGNTISNVAVTGFLTHWDNTTSFNFGGGISVSNVNVTSATTATLTLTLDPYASPGTRTAVATTAGEVASLNNAFVVQPGTPILLSSTPSSSPQQGQFSIGILGQYTNWVQGATTVQIFGNGALIGTTTVTSPQSITVTGVVNPIAFPGCANIVVTTGTQVLTLYNAFCVTPGPAAITSLSPATANQGQTLNVAITGTNTNFQSPATVATFGQGITVNTLTINSPISATANITVAATANAQANSVTFTTGGEVATDAQAFTIVAATPVIDIVYPGSAAQGQTTDVNITSSFTTFSQGNTSADFGAGVTVNSVTVNSPTTATVNVTAQPTATPGARTVRMITNVGGGSQQVAIKSNSFTVNAGSATISSAVPTTPSSVHQNDSGDIILITGSGTHFNANGLTPNVSFCSGITVAAVVVNSATSISATVNVASNAPVGACGVTVTTGGEVASGSNLFNVQAGSPVLSQVSPNSATQNATNQNVTIYGNYTHFTSGGLSLNFGAGITVGVPVVNSNTSVTVPITVDQAAVTGTRSVTVTDATDGVITLANAFTVNPGVPTLLSVAPNTGAQASTQTVTITGVFTHFVQGSSQVSVSGSGVTVGAVTVNSLTQIQVPFTVTNGAAAGARTVTVTTNSESVSLGSAFTVQPGVPNVTQITPNIGVPNSNVSVTITGSFTNWVNGTTTANFGAGVSVNGGALGADGVLTVTGPTTATAALSIDPGAALGARNVSVTTGAQVLTVLGGFTVQANTTTPPVVSYVSPAYGASNVPVNTPVTVVFSEPLNAATITSANAFLTDGTTQGGCWRSSGMPLATPPSLDASGRVLTLTPAGPLAVGRTIYLQLNSYSVPGGTPTIQDQSGNALGAYCYSFNTGFATDTTGPSFVTGSISDGATGVPTNSTLTLGFNKPVNPATISAGLTFQQAGNPVAGTWNYSSDFTQVTFTPASAFAATTAYTASFTAALTDSVGSPLANPGTLSFTTGSGPDYSGASLISYTPPYGLQPGTNPAIRFVFNKPMNPLSIQMGNVYVRDSVDGNILNGPTVTWSADHKSFQFNLSGNLNPSTSYQAYLYYLTDWTSQNGYCCANLNFTTGTAADSTPPSVVSVSPAVGSANVPVNPVIHVHFSEALDPTRLPANAITLSPSVAGTVSFVSGDYTTLAFVPSGPLSTNTIYSVQVNGVMDLSDNPMTPFAGASFTTGSTGVADTVSGTITLTPTGSSVPTNTQVVAQLNKPVDRLTVNSSSFTVYDNTGGVYIPGSISISADSKTLTLTPSTPLAPNHTFCIRASYNASFFDLAGNAFQSAYSCFTAGSTPDTTAPTVLSATPSGSGIGPVNPVVITFSKPMNGGTLWNNLAVYNGSKLVSNSYSLSNDGTTAVFNSTWPYDTTFTIVVNPGVADLAGNALGTQFSSTFTTVPQPLTTTPSVTAVRPGPGATGVADNATLSFFLSAPMNPATVNANSLKVSQNGVLLTGSISLAANNQEVVFTPPGGQFQPGALVQYWFLNTAQDAGGNALQNYNSSFTVAPDLTTVAPDVLSYGPCRYCAINQTSVIEVLFNKAIDPATLNAGNFYVLLNNSTPVSGSLSLADGGRLLRFSPSTPLQANSWFYVYPGSGLKDTNGLAYAGTNYYVYTNAVSKTAPPVVTSTAPTNGATAIGTNANIGITFSSNVDPLTLDPSNVTVTGPGGNIPISISYNASNYSMTITPQAPLPASAAVTVTLNGVYDPDGNALSPTPYALTFNTAGAPDFAPPAFVSSNIGNNQTGVAVTAGFAMQFNKPLDMRSAVYQSTVFLYDLTAGSGAVPAVLSPIGTTGLLITPAQSLSVNHQYRVDVYPLSDLNGNMGSYYNLYFTTVLTAPSGGPQISLMAPAPAAVGVPVNGRPQVQFDRPINPTLVSGITLSQGANPVPVTPILSAGNTVVTLAPNALLQPGQPYTFTVSGVQDSAGNPIAGPVSRNFTTGSGFDLNAPNVPSYTPANNSTTATNPEILLTFDKPVNPIATSSYYLYNNSAYTYVPGITLQWAADQKSVRMLYPGTLNPNSRYSYYLNFCDLANNCNGAGTVYFTTASGTASANPAVTSVSPLNGAGAVPVNAVVNVVLSSAIAPVSVRASSAVLSPAVPGASVQLAADGVTLTIVRPSGQNLAANTTYTITVPAGGVTDLSGNPVQAFTSTFTTTNSADTAPGTISLTQPSPGATGVPITQAITLTFSKPFNPASLTASSVMVYANYQSAGGSNPIAGTLSTPTPNTVVFTPAVALPPNTVINVFAAYYASITDYTGTNFSYLYGCCGGSSASFTTANTPDNTLPEVISMSPAPGSSNVGPYGGVSITFNKSLDYTTLNSSNFALFNGPTNLNAGVNYSSDRRTVTLNTTLPYGATIEAVVNPGVKDYAGNDMALPYNATFTTLPQPLTSAPYVQQSRPGNGAALNSPITLFMTAPMNLSTLQGGGVEVAQNGALISGSVSLTSDQRGIVWTPAANYLPGALIEVYLTATAQDVSGNPANAYKFTFTTANVTSSPTVTAYVPARYSYNGLLPTTQVVEVQFSEPLKASSISAASATVNLDNPGGTVISGTPQLSADGTVLSIPITTDFAGGHYYYVTLSNTIQDVSGVPFAGDSYYFYAYNAALDNTPPTVQSITPGNGSSAIGDNAPVRIVFSKLIDGISLNPGTLSLKNGVNALPYTMSFSTINNGSQSVVNVTPQSPLPDSAAITVSLTGGAAGIHDNAGNPLASQSTAFTTMAGADFTGATAISQSVDYNNHASVPVNSTFTTVFDKPLDPATVTSGGFYVYDSSYGNLPMQPPSVSADGKTVTIAPQSPLQANHYYFYVYCSGATDLNGNPANCPTQYFSTSSGSDTTPPVVVNTNPQINGAAVPRNAAIEIIFNKPLRATSLGGITLSNGANVPLANVALNSGGYTDDTVVRLYPGTILQPMTTYTVSVTGVQDVAGNTMTGTYTFSFTTGENFNSVGLTSYNASITTAGGAVPLVWNTTVANVLDSPTITITFDHGVDFAALLHNGFSLLDASDSVIPGLSLNYALSADQKTVTITTSVPLTSGAQYHLRTNYYGTLYDISGNGPNGLGSDRFVFTAQ